MSLGRKQAEQKSMWLIYDQLPQSQGHVFYERLQKFLHQKAFDAFLEKLCAPFYAEKLGRRFISPGRYFCMLLISYFEGIDSERDICYYVLYEKFKGKKVKKKEQLKIAKKTMSIDGQTYLPAEVFEQLLKRDTFTMKIGKKKKEVLHGRLYTFLKDNQYIFNYI